MFQFLRLSIKFLAVLRLSVNPIETLVELRICWKGGRSKSWKTGKHKKTWPKNAFRIRIFLRLSFTSGIETINTFIHARSYLENNSRFQTKMGKICTCFQTKKAQKPYPKRGGAHTYIAYIFPPPGLTPLTERDRNSPLTCLTCYNDIYFFYRFFIKLYIHTSTLYSVF